MSAASLASVLAVVGLAGCQQSDVDSLEMQTRSVDAFITDHSAEGKLEYRIWDMLDGSSKTTTHLRFANGGPRDGEVEVVLPDGMEPDRGTYLRAHGDFDDSGVLVADDVEIIADAPVPLIDPEWAPLRRLATILVFWDQPGLPNNEAKSSMFLGNTSTHVFYGENSYGKENMIGEVFGPYQIPDPGGCSTGFIAAASLQAMIDKGHDPDDYIQHMYVFPFISGCGFGGLASLGSPNAPAGDSWYNGSFGCVVRNQEIGHNYGMGHSRAYDCNDEEGNDVPLSDDCNDIEYGHPYDPMGGGCGHMNNVQKRFMGWLEGCNIVRAPVDGTYNISPTELPCNGTQSLMVPASDGRFYYLEYRQPLGQFDDIPGVLLHMAPGSFGGGPASYILDVGEGGFMSAGDSFTDPAGTVTIEVTEEHPSHAVVQVTFADGGSGEPSCIDDTVPEMDEGNVGLIECAAAPKGGDVVAPEVQLVYPLDGDYFLPGSDFKIIAEPSDDRIVADLELYVDGVSLFKILEEPWEWDVTNIPEGDYEFGVVARDGVNWTASNAVNIHVTNDIPEEPSDESGDEAADESDGSTGGGPIHDSTVGQDPYQGSGEGDAGENVSDESCNCTTNGRRGAPTALVLGLILVGLRRRR